MTLRIIKVRYFVLKTELRIVKNFNLISSLKIVYFSKLLNNNINGAANKEKQMSSISSSAVVKSRSSAIAMWVMTSCRQSAEKLTALLSCCRGPESAFSGNVSILS